MKNITAIYARQSADRIDSISIETQIDFCKRQLSENERHLIFSDKGYTGANTNRPEFQKMLSLCNQGKIKKIITYKLDRISRSLLDFVLLLSLLEKTDTQLISCTESFSSKSEMGVLVMKLLIMFAEMERKNIRLRVKDNYYARGEKGFYLGGYPPFGYKKCEITISGKKTSGYEIHPEESKIVKEIFRRITQNRENATSVCRYLNSNNILTKKGSKWTPPTLIRLVRNPFYVKADIKVYELICSLGGKITSDPSDFSGENGIICYGNKNKKSRFLTFENCHITVGRQEGIIDSKTWIFARSCLEFSNKTCKNTSQRSFLTGLIFCEGCGKKYTQTSSKGHTYFYCRSKKTACCDTTVKSLRSDYLEKLCEKIITNFLSKHSKTKKSAGNSQEKSRIRGALAEEKLKLRIAKKQLKTADHKDFGVILQTVISIQREISDLEEAMAFIVAKSENLCYTELKELAENFGRLAVSQKSYIAREIIEKIVVSEEKIQFFLKTK